MKYQVKIENHSFDVEIKDIHARPIVATVDGLEFEVWPQNGQGIDKAEPAVALSKDKPQPLASSAQTKSAGSGNAYASSNSSNGNMKEVRAPIPGVVIALSIQPGDEVTIGQELCVLEAMKMKNAIRASRAGKIAVIQAQVGQHVKHHDVLMEYLD